MAVGGRPPQCGEFPRRSDGILNRVVDEELVLYDLNRQRVHFLNAMAALIWDLCDGAHATPSIAEAISDLFPESRAAIYEDVKQTLQLFTHEGLIETEVDCAIGIAG